MTEMIIGIKDLHKELSSIPDQVKNGTTFIVVKNSKPAFKIVPIDTQEEKRYTLDDLFALQFDGGDPNLSANIDKIVYDL